MDSSGMRFESFFVRLDVQSWKPQLQKLYGVSSIRSMTVRHFLAYRRHTILLNVLLAP